MQIQDKARSVLPISGTHVNMSDTMVTEIFASLDYDFLWVDMEHTTLSYEQVHHHLLAAPRVRCATGSIRSRIITERGI